MRNETSSLTYNNGIEIFLSSDPFSKFGELIQINTFLCTYNASITQLKIPMVIIIISIDQNGLFDRPNLNNKKLKSHIYLYCSLTVHHGMFLFFFFALNNFKKSTNSVIRTRKSYRPYSRIEDLFTCYIRPEVVVSLSRYTFVSKLSTRKLPVQQHRTRKNFFWKTLPGLEFTRKVTQIHITIFFFFLLIQKIT